MHAKASTFSLIPENKLSFYLVFIFTMNFSINLYIQV